MPGGKVCHLGSPRSAQDKPKQGLMQSVKRSEGKPRNLEVATVSLLLLKTQGTRDGRNCREPGGQRAVLQNQTWAGP